MSESEPYLYLIGGGDEVFELHRQGLDAYGGNKPGVKPESRDCVEGKLGSAWHSELMRGEEIGALRGLCFAGHLLYYLARTQCFSDGNKRVAWTSTMTVLASLGLTIEASQEEVIKYVNEVAEGLTVRGGTEVVLWLASRLVAPSGELADMDSSSADEE